MSSKFLVPIRSLSPEKRAGVASPVRGLPAADAAFTAAGATFRETGTITSSVTIQDVRASCAPPGSGCRSPICGKSLAMVVREDVTDESSGTAAVGDVDEMALTIGLELLE
ncbi:hypothetical protein MRS76_17885 [Rhizobiaceae bacterium n13]|uniref:Uncharacterized protein n=1 Tax=Ferirhizobium litorale TaxID=2927786 RepID=A0AAE3U3R2_9HYPH|nr:hypothetical protein [Fererhizobium litorale]MDI7863828.1 hypothetical protein [Fererhizobium litorale]MDI7924072.1 hypothetical protein [Fererhizobium litorale]